MLALGAAFLTLARSMTQFIGPLWAAADLGANPGQWAYLISMRWTGVFLALIPLGLLAERVGSRLGATSALGMAGLCLIILSQSNYAMALFIFPVAGAFISFGFVTTNTLVQEISEKRRAMVNSVYRSVGAITGIVAPIVAAFIFKMTGSWSWALLSAGVCMLGGGVVFSLFPREGISKKKSMLEALRTMKSTGLNRNLRRYLWIDQLASFALLPLILFTALRVTEELKVGEGTWSVTATFGGLLGLIIVLAAGRWIDKLPLGLKGFTIAGWFGGALACVVAGMLESPAIVLPVWVIGFGLNSVGSITFPLWLVKTGGVSASTFTLHKLTTAAVNAGGMALYGYLEQFTGMSPLMIGGPLLSVFAAWLIWRTQDQTPAEVES